MHNRSDQFTKSLLRDGLSLVSAAETEVEVLAATQKIDVYSVPDPARESERAGMGLLGELSAEPSLFEPFHGTPGLRQVRQCLRKQLTWHHELERRARSAARSVAPDEDTDAPPQPAVAFPALVVIGPGRPETVLDAYRCEPAQAGVYHAVPGLVMRVVVLSELPRTRATLLLRLLGSGRRLREALADLAALPDDAWEKSVATPLLVHFRHGIQEPTTDEEDDVSAEIRAWFKEYEQKLRAEERKEGRDEGRAQGRAEEAARAVLTALRVRGIAVPDAARERILAEQDPEALERWLERAIVATSLAEVLDELS
ncbi:hypothetical protein [Sorangium atrum]|uniref:Uncharacterized protein n=1 Tax=Sorangium atrum TaxID=2995308 RepID=A0ABT5C1A6_9BACT|nr:hypothetical protein [Sorangium aterium]MDC0680184.1 hypothetical protein [Sorangium aterium]